MFLRIRNGGLYFYCEVKAITHTVCLILDSSTFNAFLREVLQAKQSHIGKNMHNLTAQKRKAFLTNPSASARNLLPTYDTTKTELTRKWLLRVIMANRLFENYDREQQEHIVDAM